MKMEKIVYQTITTETAIILTEIAIFLTETPFILTEIAKIITEIPNLNSKKETPPNLAVLDCYF